MSRHRAEVPRRLTPRYGRMAVLAVSLTTTAIALLGGLGVLPSSPAQARSEIGRTVADTQATTSPPTSTTPASPAGDPAGSEPGHTGTSSRLDAADDADDPEDAALPADSGSGRRAVFSQSRQRVWIVEREHGHDVVSRSYLVSGSVSDNLDPGTYQVYSRDMDAVGVDDSGTMRYFVRFTQGTEGAAIGFHDIPVKDGHLVQTKAQLGTPQSHGCIRQQRSDAKAMWKFAQIGTTVVVTA